MSKNAMSVLIGAVLLVTSTAMVSGDSVSDVEADVFRFVNQWPDALEWPWWLVMQAGSAGAIVAAAAVAAAIWRDGRIVLSVLFAGLGAYLLAKVIKSLVSRERPTAFLDDVIERPEWEGLGFVSGHAAVAAALVTVVVPIVSPAWRWVAIAVAVLVAGGRIYTGAHLPLDVVGGAALGVMLGAVANLLAEASTPVASAGPVDGLGGARP